MLIFTYLKELGVKQRGSGNPRARNIRIISPTNEIFDCYGDFGKVCKTLGLPFSSMCFLLKGRVFTTGKVVGWSASYI